MTPGSAWRKCAMRFMTQEDAQRAVALASSQRRSAGSAICNKVAEHAEPGAEHLPQHEIEDDGDLGDGDRGARRPVARGKDGAARVGPRGERACPSLLRRPFEGVVVAMEPLEHGACVADREPGTERHGAEAMSEKPPPRTVVSGMARGDGVKHDQWQRAESEQLDLAGQEAQERLRGCEDAHRRAQQRQSQQQGIGAVARQVQEGLDLAWPRQWRTQNARQEFARHLHAPFGPAPLLGAKAVGVGGNFAGDDEIVQVGHAPTTHLHAHAEIEIFGHGVARPTAGIEHGLAAQHATRAIEAEEATGRVARRLLDDEVAVE